jgi:hypothetical protein
VSKNFVLVIHEAFVLMIYKAFTLGDFLKPKAFVTL